MASRLASGWLGDYSGTRATPPSTVAAGMPMASRPSCHDDARRGPVLATFLVTEPGLDDSSRCAKEPMAPAAGGSSPPATRADMGSRRRTGDRRGVKVALQATAPPG